MDINYAIAFMSNDWIIANLFSLLYIIIILCIGKFLNKENREKFAIYFVYIFKSINTSLIQVCMRNNVCLKFIG